MGILTTPGISKNITTTPEFGGTYEGDTCKIYLVENTYYWLNREMKLMKTQSFSFESFEFQKIIVSVTKKFDTLELARGNKFVKVKVNSSTRSNFSKS